MRLNGWRRLGIALVVLWAVGCSVIALTEVVSEERILFAYSGPPVGTVISTEKGTITLPDGKVVQMWETAGEGFPNPWEIDWSDYPAVPIATRIEWWFFAVVALLLPAFVWILLEIAVLVIAWIRRGFTPPA
jgi:hypothetical protein